MRILDVCCKAGGAGMGYHRAGFDVTGVDIDPQPRYPFEFIQADALEYIAAHGHEYDAIHTSFPCQFYGNTYKIMKGNHPRLIEPGRELLEASGKPYIIENVPGAPLKNPAVLCGAMFGLTTYRHRLFETNFLLTAPDHPEHVAKNAKMGRTPQPGQFMHVVGNYSGAQQARDAMGIDWMTREEMAEAIPPAYTQYIGEQLYLQLENRS